MEINKLCNGIKLPTGNRMWSLFTPINSLILSRITATSVFTHFSTVTTVTTVIAVAIVSESLFAKIIDRPIQCGAKKFNIDDEIVSFQGKILEMPPVGEVFTWHLKLRGLDTASLGPIKITKFSANMPEHRHGMVTKISIKSKAENEYLIEGVKFHMLGNWSIQMEFNCGVDRSQVAIPLKL
jgi:hypothetical protein